jgi:hypothetical protein
LEGKFNLNAAEVESFGQSYHALLFQVVCHVVGVEDFRAFRPRQGVFEAMQKIDETPSDDRVVVKRHNEADNRTRDPDTAEVR